ncbi:Pentatricopeptide repeat-containing protein [Forsythia ovata]|uniref:Pentatricopeptide repeat-containing protein n=1 Tax=Forsythia ovata TaxID=205694 RepID=A0ABD1U8G1_9LAMI
MEWALDNLGVELTTHLVVEVLHMLRFEEKLEFRFFTWAGHQEHYSHEPQAYNGMIDILSSSKYKVKPFRIMCDLLDYMKRNKEISVPIEFAKKKKIRVKTQPEINTFKLLLDAMCKCSLIEDAEAMFKRVMYKVKPNADTYNILLFGWCRVKNPARSMIVLEDLMKIGHIPDNFTYNTAIDTFCKSNMVTEAAEILDGCLPDLSTYKDLIEGMCLVGKMEAGYRVLDEMDKSGYLPVVVTYNCFLKVLCDNKDSNEALRLYKEMIEVNCVPSVQTYNMLIIMFFKIGDPVRAFKTWHFLL